MTKEEYEECKALLNAWFEEQEFAEQGAFNRARWAIKKLAEDLGFRVSDVPIMEITNGETNSRQLSCL